MPRRPTLVTYHGRSMPLGIASQLLRIGQRTAMRWAREGLWVDAYVDAYIAERERRAKAREAARARGIGPSTLHMRVVRGMSLEQASTARVERRQRRTTELAREA